MNNIVDDTRISAWYSLAVFVFFTALTVFSGFEGYPLLIMVALCLMWLAGAIAFYTLHVKAKNNQMTARQLVRRINRGEKWVIFGDDSTIHKPKQ